MKDLLVGLHLLQLLLGCAAVSSGTLEYLGTAYPQFSPADWIVVATSFIAIVTDLVWFSYPPILPGRHSYWVRAVMIILAIVLMGLSSAQLYGTLSDTMGLALVAVGVIYLLATLFRVYLSYRGDYVDKLTLLDEEMPVGPPGGPGLPKAATAAAPATSVLNKASTAAPSTGLAKAAVQAKAPVGHHHHHHHQHGHHAHHGQANPTSYAGAYDWQRPRHTSQPIV